MKNRTKFLIVSFVATVVATTVHFKHPWAGKNNNHSKECPSTQGYIQSVSRFSSEHDVADLLIIRGFGGYIPVPNVYGVILADYANGSYQLAKTEVMREIYFFDPFRDDRSNDCELILNSPGNIVFGRLASCNYCNKAHFDGRRDQILQDYSYNGVSILLLRPLFGKDSPHSLLMFDENEYLEINDTNVSLLNAIIESFLGDISK